MYPVTSLSQRDRNLGKATPLRLAGIEHQVFGDGRPYTPVLLSYFADLADQFRQPYYEEYFARATPNSFTEMAAEMLPAATASAEPFDLVVVAHTTPDARPGRPACFLSHALTGKALAFAVSEQGTAAPFTAIRLAGDYARAGGYGRALVLIVEQSFLWNGAKTELPAGTRMPGRDSAVAVVLATDGALGPVTVRHFADVAAVEVDEVVTAALRDLAASDLPTTMIAGAGVEGELGVDYPIQRAAGDLPCTGVWSGFAGGLAQWTSTGQRVVLVDYDPTLRYVSLCTMDVPPGPG
ncbi:hypothetical protein [Nocardia sp. NPDC057030]|uniref:hypothetical protein n=1 Tax=unclassified Nocardia TaxID=2637762 RepID=UPI00363147AD